MYRLKVWSEKIPVPEIQRKPYLDTYVIFSFRKRKQYFSFSSLSRPESKPYLFFAFELYLSVALLGCNSLNDAWKMPKEIFGT